MKKMTDMTVAVFVDCQNDFLKGGALAFGYPKKDNFGNVLEFARLAKKHNWQLYATRDTHEATTKAGKLIGGYMSTLEGKRLPVEHCIRGSHGWEVDSRLDEVLDGDAEYVDKFTFGSFDLKEKILGDVASAEIENVREIAVSKIYLCGYCSSICVAANAVILRAEFPDTEIAVVEDCCGDVNKKAHDAAMTVLKMQQIDIIKLDDLLKR